MPTVHPYGMPAEQHDAPSYYPHLGAWAVRLEAACSDWPGEREWRIVRLVATVQDVSSDQ